MLQIYIRPSLATKVSVQLAFHQIGITRPCLTVTDVVCTKRSNIKSSLELCTDLAPIDEDNTILWDWWEGHEGRSLA